MDISAVVNLMLVLLIILVVGIIANRTGIIDGPANRSFSKMVLSIAQSAMILSSVMNVAPSMNGLELLSLVGVSFLMYVMLFLLSFLVRWILRVPKKDRGTYQFATMFANVGFMGFPIIASVLGSEAVFYASLFNIPFNILVYSLGIFLISGREGGHRFNAKELINAPFIATVAAVLIFVLKVPIPAPVAEATALLGDMVVPAAMLVIGSSLGGIPLREAFADWRLYAFAPLCLILSPVLVWSVLRLFVSNPVILSMATIMAALPVATNSTMLCMQYDGNETLASKTVFVTTVLSVVTIPLIVSLLL